MDRSSARRGAAVTRTAKCTGCGEQSTGCPGPRPLCPRFRLASRSDGSPALESWLSRAGETVGKEPGARRPRVSHHALVVHDAVLASAPHADTFGYSMPPPGLLRLGGAVERAGFSVALEDLAFRLASGDVPSDDGMVAACAERLLNAEPRVALGLSCMGATLPAALAIARCVRERAPNLPILLGGPGTTDVEVRLLERFAWIDAIARGEGEVLVPEVLARLASGSPDLSDIEGLYWRRSDGSVQIEAPRTPLANLDDLPELAWHLVPSLDRYKAITGEDDGLVPVDSGRGCVYDCSFCSIGRTWNRRSRTVPVARLVREIDEAMALPSAKQAYLCHDIFGVDRRYALELCAELERRGSVVPFEIRARLDHLSDELIDALGRAGCYRVLLGIETGDAALRNVHGKRMDEGLDVLERIERLDRAGISSILSLVLALPGEGDEQLRATLNLCLDAALRAPVHLSLHLPNPQPGCDLGARDGGQSRPVDGVVPDMAWGAGTTATERELIDAYPDLFGTFALMTEAAGGLDRLLRLRALADALPSVLMRYPRTFALAARQLGLDVLDTWYRFAADGRAFQSWALATCDRRVHSALNWERAIVRTAARGDAPPRNGLRCAATVRIDFDPRTDPLAWRAEDQLDAEPARDARALAVIRAPNGAVRTVSIGLGLAQVLESIDGLPVHELDEQLEELLPTLVERGLVATPANTSNEHDRTRNSSTAPAR